MFLSDFSIRRPIATLVIILALMCLGLLALTKLRVNQYPDIEPPVLSIVIPYPGASPESVEREIITRIEKSLQSIPGVDHVYAEASEGSANIWINFNFSKNMIEASDEARNVIAAVRYKLPQEMREPIFQRVDPSAQPVMILSLSSTSQSHADISRLAEDSLVDRLRAVDGVATVVVGGSLKRELSVLLHAQKLHEYNVSVAEVVTALRNENATAPVGTLHGPLEDHSIRLSGRIRAPADYERIVIARHGDEAVRLAQVATISDGFADVNDVTMRNGKPNVGFFLTRSRDASTVDMAIGVRKLVKEIGATLPAGTKLEITSDGGRDAKNQLGNVVHALVLGAGLTIVVVYLFLNSWRSTLVTSLSLPTSVIAALIVVWLCGFTLNFMSLLGLSLAIGVLIDDAIVVRENIVRHMEAGADPVSAARNGTREIGVAVAASTFAIIAVFVPVAFMPGEAGQWFKPFALTVAFSVLVSLFISFTLDPMLSAYWGDPAGYHRAEKRGIGRQLARLNGWFDRQSAGYGKVVGWALRHRGWMTLIALAAFAGAIALQLAFGGTSFLPVVDTGKVRIDVRSPPTSSLPYSQLKVDKAVQVAHTLPDTRATDSTANAGGGRIYVNIGTRAERKRSAADVAADLRRLLANVIGAEYVVSDDLASSARTVEIEFSGTDSRKLMEITNAYMDKLRQVKGAVDVGLSEQDPKDELQIELDRGLASTLGVSVNDVAQTMRVAFAGVPVGDWIDPTGEARDVAVRLDPADRVSAQNIERLPIAVNGGRQMVPLEQIAHITMSKGPSHIAHTDGRRVVTVSANAQGRSAGEVTDDAMALARSIDFPPGYGIYLGGASRSQKELFTAMAVALAMGIGLMYLILVVQFGSFSAPLAIMLSLPLSLIGVVLALLLTGGSLNLMSLIGVIMLMGLVAKNAILLLDCTRNLEAQGTPRSAALVLAGQLRLRPIVMTSFALIAGMLPVAVGGGEGAEFYRPLAVAIIGGTITSTLLTLLVVPTFYDSIELACARIAPRFRRRRVPSQAGTSGQAAKAIGAVDEAV